MKSISTVILFICLMAATFSNWCIIAAFHINQHYITETLCENKGNSAIHCNGHCYLNKQLSKQSSPASPFNVKNSEKPTIQLYCIPGSPFILNWINVGEIPAYSTTEIFFSPQQYTASCFRPPCA